VTAGCDVVGSLFNRRPPQPPIHFQGPGRQACTKPETPCEQFAKAGANNPAHNILAQARLQALLQ
jgi:hypothetical protein